MAAAPESTADRILVAALELFSEHGFEGTTLQQIADRLGVTKAALYYHFRSKDELLSALVDPAVADLDDLLNEHESGRSTAGRRRAFLDAYIDYLLRHRALIVYISQDLAVLSRPAFAGHAEERRRRLGALLLGSDLGFADRVRVAMAFGGLQAAIVQHPGAPTDELRQALHDAARTLLRTRPRLGCQPASPPIAA
jgi:AcrR family transcriptional regulator